MSNKIKSYKGFNPDFTCRDFQYEVGKEYEMPDHRIRCCSEGFHACESPLEVLDFYFFNDKGELCRFAEVEQSGRLDREDNKSTKVCSSKIKVKAELKLGDLIRAGVEWIKEQTDPVGGSDSQLADNGKRSAQIGSSGDSAQIGSSGDSAQIGSSGDYAKIGSSGDSAKIDSTGADSVICCAGHGSRVKAELGSWVTLAEWEYDDAKQRAVPVKVVSFQIDGKTYRADTWYRMMDGKIEEV